MPNSPLNHFSTGIVYAAIAATPQRVTIATYSAAGEVFVTSTYADPNQHARDQLDKTRFANV